MWSNGPKRVSTGRQQVVKTSFSVIQEDPEVKEAGK
jgi:hypothetical protein